MSSPGETTSLLHSGQNGDTVDTDNDLTISDSLQQVPTKTPTPDDTAKDIEANEVNPCSDDATGPPKISTTSLIQVVAVLMIGLFTASVDGSLILATHPRIASEFDALEDSSWLFVSFLLGGVATQVLRYIWTQSNAGILLWAIWYWMCHDWPESIHVAGDTRTCLIWICSIGDGESDINLIPLREVASWLGYINIVGTTGRSIGGPLGGFLADQVGWRWSFSGQAPLFAIAMIASTLVIPNTKAPESQRGNSKGLKAWLSRIDLAGSLLLGVGVLLCMLPIELGGVKVPWTHPLVAGLFSAGILTLVVFAINEARWAEEPAFPLRLINNRDILSPYVAMCCIAGAQTSLMYFVPLYFQVTSGASNTIAGLHLVPAVVGNAVGGLVAGYFIRRTGNYKAVLLGSSLFASIGYLLLVIRCGFGAGMSGSAVFVSLNAVVEPVHKAVVTSGIQLAIPIGMLLGVTAGSAVMLDVIQRVLDKRLFEIGLDLESRTEIIKKSIASVDYIRQLPGDLEDIVIGGYVVGLRASFVISLTGLAAGFLLRQRRL
ncbi:hypothetical protein CIB48_g5620 [Xylaria polymorpha]|nr:hypothetical protein CIB48_g5620 [Xylaria polymorpha]